MHANELVMEASNVSTVGVIGSLRIVPIDVNLILHTDLTMLHNIGAAPRRCEIRGIRRGCVFYLAST